MKHPDARSFSLQGLRDSLLLLLWGGFVLWLSFSGQLCTYLHPSLQPYTTAAGVVFLLLAVFGFRAVISNAHRHGHGRHGSCCDHQHGSGEGLGEMAFKTVLLLLPLAIIISGKATAYSITTVQNRGVVDNINKLPSANPAALSSAKAAASSTPAVDSASTSANQVAGCTTAPQTSSATNAPAPIAPGGPMPLQVIDMLYAVQMPSYRGEFEGRDVELVGQYVPMTTGNPKGDRFQAIRMFISCCAADAKPVGVTVQYPKPLKVAEMGWLKITGKPTFPMEGGRRTAVLEASKVEECPAPNEPFVY
jgi:uncharacterized repeat protein (TIGR03943 family)